MNRDPMTILLWLLVAVVVIAILFWLIPGLGR